jgi:ketosteroid isomerase-like protein
MSAEEVRSLAVATRFFEAGKAHDLNTMKTLITDDFVVWYNFNDLTLDRSAFVAFMSKSYATDMTTEYVDVRITPSSSGFVEEGALRLTVGGHEYFARFCLVGTLRDGKQLCRLHEYFDSKDMPSGLGAGNGNAANF